MSTQLYNSALGDNEMNGGERRELSTVAQGDRIAEHAKLADGFDPQEYLVAQVTDAIRAKLTEVAALQEQLAIMEALKGPFVKFKIIIHGKVEGQIAINEIIEAESLSEAVQFAVSKFKIINNTDVIYATGFSVSVCIGDDQYRYIPGAAVKPLFDALSAE